MVATRDRPPGFVPVWRRPRSARTILTALCARFFPATGGIRTVSSTVAPWAEPRQVEQDLIIARALVELFSDPFLSKELRFRGGTALNKLHFQKPLRYSEDIDLTRTKGGASKPIWDRVHDLLDPWLGDPEYLRSPVAPALRYSVAAEDGSLGLNGRIRSEEMTRFIYALKEIRACLEAEILTDVQQRLVLLSRDMDNHNGQRIPYQPAISRS